MDSKKIKQIIDIYISDLSRWIKVDRAILFGSALRGKIGNDTDIDLLVISSSFKKMNTDLRFDILYKARKNPLTQTVPMDIFGLTAQEYDNANSLSIAGEIKDTGREIFNNQQSFF